MGLIGTGALAKLMFPEVAKAVWKLILRAYNKSSKKLKP